MLGDGRRLNIVEIFYTLQGEGPQAGWPAIFVRLAKCNLRCYFCDTSFEEGKLYELNTLLEEILTLSSQHKCNLVVLTGGEPLLQNVIPLVQSLNRADVSVSIETAGTVWVDNLDKHYGREAIKGPEKLSVVRAFNLLICSPKTKSVHPRIRPLVAAWKYVLRSREASPDDGLPMMSTQRLPSGIINEEPCVIFRPDPALDHAPIYVQPMDEGDSIRNHLNAHLVSELCLKYGYRQSVQTHKLTGLR